MSLFIALHLDEDVSAVLAEALRARDFDVTTTQEKGLREAEDHEQLAHAVREGRCIVTHNRVHFQNLATSYFNEGRGGVRTRDHPRAHAARPRASTACWPQAGATASPHP